MDSNHRSQLTTDLQSVPFGRSGTPPYNCLKKTGVAQPGYPLELVNGLEPLTC